MRRRTYKRRRRKNPSLADIDETTKLILIVGGIAVVVYFGEQIFSAIGGLLSGVTNVVTAPFKAIGNAAVSVAQYESPSQTANTGATGDPITDSLAVGAAGGG
jgi:hypothetical protein